MSKAATPAQGGGRPRRPPRSLAAIVLYLVPSNDYLLLPDRAHPVAPLVRVQGGHTSAGPGGIYFVDVFERRASMFESLFPWIHTGATLVPANLIVPPGVSDNAARQADLREMTISQKVAAAVALRRLGYKVVAKPSGVIVAAIDASSHAIGKLQPSDLIVAVNGAPTPTIAGLRAQLAKVKAGRPVTLKIDRGVQHLTVPVETIADPQNRQARDHRLRARAGGDDQAAAEGADRRRQRGRPVRRARVRARGARGPRPPRRPRLQGGRDGRDRA